MNTPMLSKGQRIVLIVAFVIVAPLAVLALWPGLFGQSMAKFPGSLLIESPVSWTAPSGESISGLMLYTPEEGSVSSPFAPNLGVLFAPGPGTFSADGEEALGTEMTPSSTTLVAVSRRAQAVDHTIDVAPAGTAFAGLLWASGSDKVAYIKIPSLHNLPLAPDGKPYFVTNGATSTLRAGISLPDAFQPSVYATSLDGSAPVSLGQGRPIMFSPDGSQILMLDSKGLEVVDLANGSRSSLSGISGTDFAAYFVADSADSVILAGKADASSTLYHIDWQSGTASPAGNVSETFTNAFFMNGELVTMEPQSSTAHSYVVKNGALAKGPAYTLALPPQGTVIGWIP